MGDLNPPYMAGASSGRRRRAGRHITRGILQPRVTPGRDRRRATSGAPPAAAAHHTPREASQGTAAPQDDSGAAWRRTRTTGPSKVVLLSLRPSQPRTGLASRVVAPVGDAGLSLPQRLELMIMYCDDSLRIIFSYKDKRGTRGRANNQLKQPPARPSPRPSPRINKRRPPAGRGSMLRGVIQQ